MVLGRNITALAEDLGEEREAEVLVVIPILAGTDGHKITLLKAGREGMIEDQAGNIIIRGRLEEKINTATILSPLILIGADPGVNYLSILRPRLFFSYCLFLVISTNQF